MPRQLMHPPTLMALAILAAWLAPAQPAEGARHAPPQRGVPPGRGPGRIIPVLGDGTLREPSIDRAKAIDQPDSLPARRLVWDVTLAGVTTDRIGTLDMHGAEVFSGSVTYGLGGGADACVRFGAWERTQLDLADTSGSETASGLSATTVIVGRTVQPAAWHGAGVRYAAFARIAGASSGPGPRQAEVGAMLSWGRPLGDAGHVSLSATPAWVGNTIDAGHHVELAAGLVVSREVGDHASFWLEGVSVSSREDGRPWLGVVDGGVRLDLLSHAALTLGASVGRGGGRNDVGALVRIGVHS